MALKGRLRDFSLTQLLNLINLARKTGSLKIDAPQGQADIYFREGKLIHATMGKNGTSSGQLAELLVRAGKLTEEQSRSLVEQGRARNDKELGLLLINAGYINQKDILQSIRNHLLEVVYTAFTWEDGSFEFNQNLEPPSGRISVPINLENIILEGSRRREELAELQTELPSLDVILRVNHEGPNLRKINLSVDEWRVISFINPRNTVAQIAQYNDMSEFQVRKIVSKLLRDGLVEIISSGPGAKSRPSLLGRQPQAQPVAAAHPTAATATAAPAAVEQIKSRTKQPSTQPKVEKSIIRRLISRIRGL